MHHAQRQPPAYGLPDRPAQRGQALLRTVHPCRDRACHAWASSSFIARGQSSPRRGHVRAGEQLGVAAADPVAVGRWWAEALGWAVVNDASDEDGIRPAPDGCRGSSFLPVPEKEAIKFCVLGECPGGDTGRCRIPERTLAIEHTMGGNRRGGPSDAVPWIKPLGVGEAWHRPPTQRGPSS
ncbi:VOC family protein [Streptomyces sp. NPDC007905]|uniref:VOC family protein n=1 Tax=Streptomyces sp. NPDC007905 TaxID=3364788 RepID=UPI0036E62772